MLYGRHWAAGTQEDKAEKMEVPGMLVQVPESSVLQFQKSPVGIGLLQPANVKSKAPLFSRAPPLDTYWNENWISVTVTFAGTVAGLI
jgi:hypothetical protein